jgi:hypothetical protein
MFSSAERRSITGRWNTIACRAAAPRPRQEIDPEVGAAARAEPHEHALARAVGSEDDRAAPASILSETRSMMRRPPASKLTHPGRAAA